MIKKQKYYKGANNYNDSVVNRRSDIQKKIIERYVKNKNVSILDIGSYGGLLLGKLYTLGYKNLYACDVFNSKNTIGVPVSFSIEDITHRTKFKSNMLDLVIASHVLEHIYDIKSGLNEIRRILKNKGYLLVTVPLDVNISARVKIFLQVILVTLFK